MAAAAALTAIRDGNNIERSVRSIDESGAGTGPFDPIAVFYDGQDVAGAAKVLNAEEGISSTKYGLLTRVVGLLASLGSLTETAPASDTASSGLNGRLQRISQRLTSLIALVPAALTSLGNFKVSLQEDAFGTYETVAASQTAQPLGATGATGDYIKKLIIIPAATNAGNVALLDNATSISVFVTGTLADLTPIVIDIGAYSVSGAWKITTGANVSVVAFGNFT